MEQEKKYTRFEKARLIGARALQISQGAPLMIKLSDDELKGLHYDPIHIAKKEFEEGASPLIVVEKQSESEVVKKKKK